MRVDRERPVHRGLPRSIRARASPRGNPIPRTVVRREGVRFGFEHFLERARFRFRHADIVSPVGTASNARARAATTASTDCAWAAGWKCHARTYAGQVRTRTYARTRAPRAVCALPCTPRAPRRARARHSKCCGTQHFLPWNSLLGWKCGVSRRFAALRLPGRAGPAAVHCRSSVPAHRSG